MYAITGLYSNGYEERYYTKRYVVTDDKDDYFDRNICPQVMHVNNHYLASIDSDNMLANRTVSAI